MNIVVLVKQVPSTESFMEIGGDGKSVKDENINYVMNPYDEIAVEEALRIKEEKGGSVTLLSLGPDRCTEAIKTGIAMGADAGMQISQPDLGVSPLNVAKLLAAQIKTMDCDLVVAGQRAVDTDGYLTGLVVAEELDIPCATLVLDQNIDDGKIKVTRSIDGGTEDIAMPLPALITTQRGLNEPRYTSLKGLMMAKKKKIAKIDPTSLGVDLDSKKSGLVVKAIKFPEERVAGKIIEGDAQSVAAELVSDLISKEVI